MTADIIETGYDAVAADIQCRADRIGARIFEVNGLLVLAHDRNSAEAAAVIAREAKQRE